MTTSLLVNKMWATSYMRISSIDAHIPSPRFINTFFGLIAGKTALFDFDPAVKAYPKRFCQSLTFTFPNNSLVPKKDDLVAVKGLFYVMNKLQPDSNILPHLSRIAIHFENYVYEEGFPEPGRTYFMNANFRF